MLFFTHAGFFLDDFKMERNRRSSGSKGWVAGPETPKIQALPEWGGV